jgi:DeoR family glycerol-3-phosphate regulon repressor
VHAEAGLTDYYPHEVTARRVMIAHAGASYVLADSSKLGNVAVHRVCALTQVTAVITNADNSNIAVTAADALAAAGCDLLRAPVPRAAASG